MWSDVASPLSGRGVGVYTYEVDKSEVLVVKSRKWKMPFFAELVEPGRIDEFCKGVHGCIQRPFLKGDASIIRYGSICLIILGPELSIFCPDPSNTLDYRLQFMSVQF